MTLNDTISFKSSSGATIFATVIFYVVVFSNRIY